MTDTGQPDSMLQLSLPFDSLCPVYIEMMYSPDGPDASSESRFIMLARGTGFFYRVDGQIFLVTARHNFSGKHWENNEWLRNWYKVAPTHVAIGLRSASAESVQRGSIAVGVHQYLLRLIDEAWKPAWREHPRCGRSIDIAALGFRVPEDRGEVLLRAWDEAPAAADPAAKLWVTQDVAIAGYPYGLRGGFDLPIWISGGIASEPSLLHPYRGKEYPLFLVDARTRKGQSGSPVVTVRQPGCATIDNNTVKAPRGPLWKLVGVYSGRIPEDYGAKEGSAFGAGLPPEQPSDGEPIDDEATAAELDEGIARRFKDIAWQVKKIADRTKRGSDLGFVWRIQEATEICRNGVPGETGPVDVNPSQV